MPFHPQRVGLILLLCAAASTLSAQRGLPETATLAAKGLPVQPSAKSNDAPPAAARPLNPDEGLSILGAALESRGRRKADCSHLVHDIYERAGFSYDYAKSSDIYHGIDEFRRVLHPQPGDVIAWAGHMGIVVNPVQHSFFSALRSGLGVDSYTTAYWKQRGRARFYRYLKSAPATDSAAAEDAATGADADPAGPRSAAREDELPATPAEAGTSSLVSPRVLVTSSHQPSPEQISQAVAQTSHQTGQALSAQNLLDLPQPLIVFDHLEVERVHIQRDQGWAEVRFHPALSVSGGKVQGGKRSQRQRWFLYRQDRNSWEVVLPREAIYLPREAAVRILAHQLAILADSEEAAATRQGAQLAQLLNTLLVQQP